MGRAKKGEAVQHEMGMLLLERETGDRSERRITFIHCWCRGRKGETKGAVA